MSEITSEEYKVETQVEVNRIQYQKSQVENYTNFERKSKVFDLFVYVNPSSVIAKTDMSTIVTLQEKGIICKTDVPYHPDNLKQYSTQIGKLRSYNNLGIPDNIWASKDRPAAFRFGDVVYLIAPRLETSTRGHCKNEK